MKKRLSNVAFIVAASLGSLGGVAVILNMGYPGIKYPWDGKGYSDSGVDRVVLKQEGNRFCFGPRVEEGKKISCRSIYVVSAMGDSHVNLTSYTLFDLPQQVLHKVSGRFERRAGDLCAAAREVMNASSLYVAKTDLPEISGDEIVDTPEDRIMMEKKLSEEGILNADLCYSFSMAINEDLGDFYMKERIGGITSASGYALSAAPSGRNWVLRPMY